MRRAKRCQHTDKQGQEVHAKGVRAGPGGGCCQRTDGVGPGSARGVDVANAQMGGAREGAHDRPPLGGGMQRTWKGRGHTMGQQCREGAQGASAV